MISTFECVGNNEAIHIIDYQEAPNIKFKAVKKYASAIQDPVIVNFQTISKDLVANDDLISKLHEFHLCPGILESEILPFMSNFVNANLSCVMFFIEKINEEVFYRSRNCQLIFQEKSSKLCQTCEDLFKNLFDLFQNLEETPTTDTVKMEVEPDQNEFEFGYNEHEQYYSTSYENESLKKETKEFVKKAIQNVKYEVL